jgi:hypothetical protein
VAAAEFFALAAGTAFFLADGAGAGGAAAGGFFAGAEDFLGGGMIGREWGPRHDLGWRLTR